MTTTISLPAGTGVMLCGHGSRNQLAVGEFATLAEALRRRLPGVPVEYGYLEFANPVLHAGLDKLRAQGLKRILAVPGMPRTTSPPSSTPMPPPIRGSRSPTAANSASI